MLKAGIAEFSKRGYEGARVDVIAHCAKANKQLLYYYFNSKSGLYIATIERAYLRFRGNEKAIRASTSGVNAETALHRLAAYLFRQSAQFLQFQRLLQDLNLHGGRHLRKVTGVREAYAVLVDVVADILDRGVNEGRFRQGIDPKEFYISLVGVISARISNATTLSYVLDIDLLSDKYAHKSQKYAVDLLLNGITQ